MTQATGIHAHPSRKLGFRPADPARLANTLTFRLTGLVPAHPTVADHLSKVTAWNGDTNFNFGTCGPCSVANSVIITWKYLLGEDITVSDEAIFDLYRRSGNPGFDPATDADDNGVDMTVMLSALVKGGIEITRADGSTEVVKPVCFGKIPQAIDDVRAVTSIFGFAILAAVLQTAQQAQTDAGLWDYSPSSEWGGHAFCGGSYTSALGHKADETVITWMQPCGTTDAFWSHQGQEAYAVVWSPLWDHPAFQAGIDQAVLASSYQQVTGKPLPAPAPAPVPPGNAAAAFKAVLEAKNAAGQEWPDQRHSGYVTTVARAARAWRDAGYPGLS